MQDTEFRYTIEAAFSENSAIADWIAATDFSTPYPMLIYLLERRGDNEPPYFNASESAIIWAIADIVASINQRRYNHFSDDLKFSVGKLTCPHPLPELAGELLRKVQNRSELRQFLEADDYFEQWSADIDMLLKRLESPTAGVGQLPQPALEEAREFFRTYPISSSEEMTDKNKQMYLCYGSYLLFHFDYELLKLVVRSLGRGDGVYELMFRIIKLQERRGLDEGIVRWMLSSEYPSVRYYGVRLAARPEDIFPLLNDPDDEVRDIAIEFIDNELNRPSPDCTQLAEAVKQAAERASTDEYREQLLELLDRIQITGCGPADPTPGSAVKAIAVILCLALAWFVQWLAGHFVHELDVLLRLVLGGMIFALLLLGSFGWLNKKS